MTSKGARGFVLWANKTFTGDLKPIADAINRRVVQLAAHAQAAGLSGFGDVSLQPIDITATYESGSNPTPTDAATATSAAPASSGWASDLSSLVSSLASAYVTGQQLSTVNKITDINLQRAQAGLSPIPTNLSTYGVQGVGVNVGLSSSTQQLLIWGGIGLAAVLVVSSLARRR